MADLVVTFLHEANDKNKVLHKVLLNSSSAAKANDKASAGIR